MLLALQSNFQKRGPTFTDFCMYHSKEHKGDAHMQHHKEYYLLHVEQLFLNYAKLYVQVTQESMIDVIKIFPYR